MEETLSNEKTELAPTAYFAALLALLRERSSSSSNAELRTSIVYLLDIVSAFVPAPLLRSQFTTILSQLVPIITDPEAGPAIAKSSIGCLESLLKAQDAPAWSLPSSQIGPRKATTILLALATDPRPKVRKRALEALTDVLKTPPRGPSLDHPAAELCAVTALSNLRQAVEAAGQIRKQRRKQEEGYDPHVLHALHMTKTIAKASQGWPSKNIEPLCEILMSISRSSNDYLVMGAFEVFEVIFKSMQDEISSAKLPHMMEAIEELQPAKNDSSLLPPWIAVLSRGYQVSAQIEPEETFSKLPQLFDRVSAFLTSPAHNIRISASECLTSFLANCIPNSTLFEPSVYDEKVFESLGNKANELLGIKYQSAWMEVFKVLVSFLDTFRWRGNPYLLSTVKAIGDLRANESFQGKKQADEVIAHAISNIGPEALLQTLPLNLAAPATGQPGRAWLLPLLRDNVSNTSLAHFKSEFVPLSQLMYQRVMDHGEREKTMEIKIYETVVHQIWATLPGYCDLPQDVPIALDQGFVELLANLLYKQIDLRHDVCRALQNLVETNQAVLSGEIPEEELRLHTRMSKTDAQRSLDHIASFASNLLAVLFNVYGQTLPQHRGYILQCISAYLSITPEKVCRKSSLVLSLTYGNQDLVDTFSRVVGLLESSFASTLSPAQDDSKSKKQSKNSLPPESHTLVDLLITISTHLPVASLPQLFSLASRIITTSNQDPQLIKKAYRLIPRLASTSTGTTALQARHSDLQSLILQTTNSTPPAARYPRLLALDTLVSTIPPTELHFIPSILSEVVLACRSTSNKARQTAFSILIHAVNVVTAAPSGTSIRNSLVPGMLSDAPDAPATIEEMFTMVSAGLAGGAPSVVAATATALGRLVFEFHSQLAKGVLADLVDTVGMFLESNSREIVRAVLGFVKVAVVVLPDEVLKAKGMALVQKIVPWCKEHKGRLRVKVKGILERCVRRWGAEEVERWVVEIGNEDGRKLVRSIRKERERRKKKKGGRDAAGDESGDDNGPEKAEFDNELDKAVYGSDEDDDNEELSELGSDSDVDMGGVSLRAKNSSRQTSHARGKQTGQFIREDLDDDDAEPLDLLAPEAMARISSRKTLPPTWTRKTKARVNEDGKLVFGAAADDDQVMQETTDDIPVNGGGVDAYTEAISGPDAIRRGQKGRMKVKQRSAGGDGARGGGRGDWMDIDRSNSNANTHTNTRDDDNDDDVRREAANLLKSSSRGAPHHRKSMSSGRPTPTQTQTQRRGLGVEKRRGPVSPSSSSAGVTKAKTKMMQGSGPGRGGGRGRVGKTRAAGGRGRGRFGGAR